MQQINLLNTIIQQKKNVFPAQLLFLACGAVFVILIIISLSIEIKCWQAQYALKKLTATKDAIENNYQKLTRQYPLLVNSKILPLKLTALTTELSKKNKIWEHLTG